MEFRFCYGAFLQLSQQGISFKSYFCNFVGQRVKRAIPNAIIIEESIAALMQRKKGGNEQKEQCS